MKVECVLQAQTGLVSLVVVMRGDRYELLTVHENRSGGTKETRGALGSDLFRFFPLPGGFFWEESPEKSREEPGEGGKEGGS